MVRATVSVSHPHALALLLGWCIYPSPHLGKIAKQNWHVRANFYILGGVRPPLYGTHLFSIFLMELLIGLCLSRGQNP
jgi:hypothetical protein